MKSDSSMARKCWFSLVKTFFITDTDINQHKKKRKRRWFLGRFKIKRLPSIPEASPSRDEEEQIKQDSNVDIFITDAADEIAADIFDQPSSTSQYTFEREEESRKFSSITFKHNAPSPISASHWRRVIQEFAATKIQKAFRGYLALKGIVRLQATIRGILVRQQAITTLNKLQSVVHIQSQVRAKRSQMLDGSSCSQGNKQVIDNKGKDIKIDFKSQRRWDDSLLTKEEENDLCSSKRMAAIKRERIKEYSLSNRRSAELEQNKIDGRWKYWLPLEQWVDTRIFKREDQQNLATVFSDRERNKDDEPGVRSFHNRKKHSIGNRYFAGGGSPVVPTYMAATKSTKAKVRSMSSPRLRPVSFDSNSETFSPYKQKLSPISSINSEMTTISKLANPSNGYSQRSPCIKGPIKSNRNSKYPHVD